MRRKLIILILLLILSSAAIVILFTDPWSTLKGGITELIPSPGDDIDMIKVMDDFDTLVLVNQDKMWQLSDGEILNQLPAESLLYSASRLQLVSIIAAAEVRDEPGSVKLQFYHDQREKASFRFLVMRGSYIIYKENAEEAYIVELPGFNDVPLGKIFSKNPDHYRDHVMINLLPGEIAEVRVDPLSGSSFSIEQTADGILTVRNGIGDSVVVEERKVRLLLSYFTAVRFNEYLDNEEVPLDMDLLQPLAVIAVVDTEGREFELKIYQWEKEPGQGPDLFEAIVLYNQSPKLMMVNYSYLDLLIRGLEVYLPDS